MHCLNSRQCLIITLQENTSFKKIKKPLLTAAFCKHLSKQI
jgi:hypothetical protein